MDGALHDLGLPFMVAEQNGEVLGYAYCGPWRPRLAHRHTAEDSLYLRPSAAGRGLGGTLLGELLQRSRAAGVHQMIAVITAADGMPVEPASVAVHKRHGFHEAGRLEQVGHKHGRWLDTLLYQRTL